MSVFARVTDYEGKVVYIGALGLALFLFLFLFLFCLFFMALRLMAIGMFFRLKMFLNHRAVDWVAKSVRRTYKAIYTYDDQFMMDKTPFLKFI